MTKAIVTPPIRTPLLMPDGDEGAGRPLDRRTIAQPTNTTREWWLYWNYLGERTNLNAKLVTQGTHADRPIATDMPNGAIYVETDRGAIYQNQNGVWQYLAGTMFGTLNPDQRPTDLGVNDAGFDFRCTDTDANSGREFLWSQTEWIEITPARYGTHAERLASNPPGIVSGELFIETDRSNVVYQVQNSAWHYVTGTMYGASIAARPTDLGANDAGFVFFANDTYVLWRWNGAAWVDRTPANDVQFAVASASLTLTTVRTDVPGATITLSRAGRYLIVGVASCLMSTGDEQIAAQVFLNANGADLGWWGQYSVSSPPAAATIAQQWFYTANTVGQIVKLRANKNLPGNPTGSQVQGGITTLSALWIGP